MIKNQNDSSEISLTSIKDSVTEVSLSGLAVIMTIYKFLFKHKWVIIITSGLGLGFGYLATSIPQKKFQLRMIVSHSEMVKKTYAEMLGQLQDFIEGGARDQLATQLNMNPTMADKIASIDALDMYGEPLIKDTSSTKTAPFIIEVAVYDNTISDTLQQRILEYFNNNKFLKQKKNTQKEVYEAKMIFVDNELSKLDSLKTRYNQFLGGARNNAMFYNNAFNPAEIYQRSNEYQYQKEMITKWLADEYESVKLIQGFKSVSRTFTAGGKLKIIIKYIAAGFFVGCAIGVFWELTQISKYSRSLKLQQQ